MTLEVLLSCMHQEDLSIAATSRLASSAVIINQADHNAYECLDTPHGLIRMFSTTERGLSRSRNMAIAHSQADLGLLADDDEEFCANYAQAICSAFEDYPQADVMLFQVAGSGKTYKSRPFRVGYLRALNFCSWQIAFRLESIRKAHITFDEDMGSGTGHGSGEEIKFLYDCLRAHLRLQYVPTMIATLQAQSPSQWFQGFTPTYFYNRGWATARYMGQPMAMLYSLYFAIRKHGLYHQDCSFWQALRQMVRGVFNR